MYNRKWQYHEELEASGYIEASVFLVQRAEHV
jgi:hypothetical protein